jgi:hypothetical protein
MSPRTPTNRPTTPTFRTVSASTLPALAELLEDERGNGWEPRGLVANPDGTVSALLSDEWEQEVEPWD